MVIWMRWFVWHAQVHGGLGGNPHIFAWTLLHYLNQWALVCKGWCAAINDMLDLEPTGAELFIWVRCNHFSLVLQPSYLRRRAVITEALPHMARLSDAVLANLSAIATAMYAGPSRPTHRARWGSSRYTSTNWPMHKLSGDWSSVWAMHCGRKFQHRFFKFGRSASLLSMVGHRTILREVSCRSMTLHET